MLEFTEVFTKGQHVGINDNDIEIMMKCKNIDYGHVSWWTYKDFYSNIQYVTHIVDNIIDINKYDNNNEHSFTYFTKILSYYNSSHTIHYVLNNGCVNEESFNIYQKLSSRIHDRFCACCPHKLFDKLTSYLTKVSLNRFKGYYNIEKYYDMIYIMLLIMKAQQKLSHTGSTLPSAVIKHLIIPFIYQ